MMRPYNKPESCFGQVHFGFGALKCEMFMMMISIGGINDTGTETAEWSSEIYFLDPPMIGAVFSVDSKPYLLGNITENAL